LQIDLTRLSPGHHRERTTRLRALCMGGIVICAVLIAGMAGAIFYANEGYAWPTEAEFKTEMVSIEQQYPGFVHELLTISDTYGGDRWERIKGAFDTVDWDAWPWQGGAFYRQFNVPAWVEFFDTYELIPLLVICLCGFAILRLRSLGSNARGSLKPAPA